MNNTCVLEGGKYPQDLLFIAFHRNGEEADYKPKDYFSSPHLLLGHKDKSPEDMGLVKMNCG